MAGMSARINPQTYTEIRLATVNYQAQLGRQISISDIITAAWKIANQHPGELLIALQQEDK